MEQPLQLDQGRLVSAWKERLPSFMDEGESYTVQADESDRKSLLIHFNAAGHQDYELDFRCTYVDSREVAVSLVDVEKAGRSTDEHSAAVQQLAQKYTRQIHECAQALKPVTQP